MNIKFKRMAIASNGDENNEISFIYEGGMRLNVEGVRKSLCLSELVNECGLGVQSQFNWNQYNKRQKKKENCFTFIPQHYLCP